jgi:protocatechuate 3,4-dioxygenase, alpha subunit
VPGLTPSQTVGPFFAIGLDRDPRANLLVDDPGALRLAGTVFDAEGPVVDALLEIWQANGAGRYAHPEDDRSDLPLADGFTGFGRCATDAEGRYEFRTVKPGPVPGPGGRPQAPHIDVSVFARGLLNRVVTRVYFPDEAEANAADPALATIEAPQRRATLVAHPESWGLRFDIHLQGESQTAFFEL